MPELKTLYHGTGNPGPWNAEQRPGDNKWTAGIFARDPATGAAHWYYQMSPHDEHDYDGINEQILLDMPFGGQMHKVLDSLGSQRLCLCDRSHQRPGAVGRSVRSGQFAPRAWICRPADRSSIRTRRPRSVRRCATSVPTASGAKDWNPSSFSPQTGLLYIPHENMCMDWMNMRGELHRRHAVCRRRSAHEARARRQSRRVDRLGSGAAPAGLGGQGEFSDLVGHGRHRRRPGVLRHAWMAGSRRSMRAPARRCGKYKVDSGIIGQPISYRGPDGHQYIAVLSGVGGWSGAVVSGPVDPRDGSAALGMVNVMSDLPKYTTAGGTLYVFCASALKLRCAARADPARRAAALSHHEPPAPSSPTRRPGAVIDSALDAGCWTTASRTVDPRAAPLLRQCRGGEDWQAAVLRSTTAPVATPTAAAAWGPSSWTMNGSTAVGWSRSIRRSSRAAPTACRPGAARFPMSSSGRYRPTCARCRCRRRWRRRTARRPRRRRRRCRARPVQDAGWSPPPDTTNDYTATTARARRCAIARLGLSSCCAVLRSPRMPHWWCARIRTICRSPIGHEGRLREPAGPILARDLHTQVRYEWWAQRRGFARQTLRSIPLRHLAGGSLRHPEHGDLESLLPLDLCFREPVIPRPDLGCLAR